VRKGKILKASDLMVTCGTEDGYRVLRICRPRGAAGLTPKQLGRLVLVFDGSGLCPTGKETLKRNCTNKSCKKRFELLTVPLREDVPDRTATSIARRMINVAFEAFGIEAERIARTTGSKEPDTTPHRVHSPARSAGTVGAPV